MADVTLTAAMRANLFSLQQTAQLMGTVQNRLSTGKKVNSALDNPNSYFAAQSLTNRASDIGSLLDGMGQAIQSIKTASQGIESAQKIVDQMKAVANSAMQSVSAGNASSASVLNVSGAQGTVDTATLAAPAVTYANGDLAAAAGQAAQLVNLVDAAGDSVGIKSGDTFIISDGTNSATFTVGATRSLTVGDGGGTSIGDLKTWMAAQTLGGSVAANDLVLADDNTNFTITNGDADTDVALYGNVAAALGFTGAEAQVGATAATGATATGALVADVRSATVTTTETAHLLTGMVDADGNSLNIKYGDTLSLTYGTNSVTFTVGETQTLVAGDGGGATLADLANWMDAQTVGGELVAADLTLSLGAGADGTIAINNAHATKDVEIGGNLAAALGFAATAEAGTASNGISAADINTVSYTSVPGANSNTLLIALTESDGLMIKDATGATTDGAIGIGDTISLAVGGGGPSYTYTVTATSTLGDLVERMNSISADLTVTLDTAGKLSVTNNTGEDVTIAGSATNSDSKLFGDADSTISTGQTISRNLYSNYGELNFARTMNLGTLDGANGTAIGVGDTLTVKVGDGDVSTITYGTGTGEVSTIQDLVNKLNTISNVSASIDAVGNLSVSATNGLNLTFGGDMKGSLGLADTSASSTAPSTVYINQFDTLRTQLDELVADADYQGTNLISGTGNNPLTVTFNEAATNANRLVINAVDLTTTGLDLAAATGNWDSTGAIQETISKLTTASSTLREQASTFGQNLTTVQTRQDFAQNMIATLKEGADKLTLADMNEEGANMLALQTRSQLGTQSLSLASQANQAVMRLFG